MLDVNVLRERKSEVRSAEDIWDLEILDETDQAIRDRN